MPTHRNGLRRTALWIGVTLAAFASLPAVANAATVGTDGTTIEYTAGLGETNQTAVVASGTDIVFTDAGASSLVDGDGAGGCSVSGGVATCPLTSFVATHVTLAAGADTLGATGNLAPLTQLTVDAGSGADTVNGSNGADILLGGGGDDALDGNQGADTVLAGTGTDTMQWDPGDANDALEGGPARDTLRFNGSAIGEQIAVSANGGRVRLTRDIANITMDLNDVEAVIVRSLAGADTTTVNDLSGTDVTEFTDDLSAIGGAGDGETDRVIVNATNGVDTPAVGASGTAARVSGLAARTTVTNADPASDQLTVNALGGDDQPLVSPGVGALIGVLIDGNADTDTVHARGTKGADNLGAIANGPNVAVTADGASIVQSVSEHLRLETFAGADVLSAVGNLAPLTQLLFDAGSGADTVNGGNGADVLLGGNGDDAIDGNQGADTVLAGTGTDTLQWDPGDGSDTLEGQAGSDELRFNGSAIGEQIAVSANGGRVRLTRDIAAITMDLNDVEAVIVRSLAGADTTTVNDLSGTDVTEFTDDLSAIGGGGDGETDRVIVNATNGVDAIDIAGSAATGVDVTGLAPGVAIRNQDPSDQLAVHTLAGADSFDTDGLEPGSILFSID